MYTLKLYNMRVKTQNVIAQRLLAIKRNHLTELYLQKAATC